MEKPSKFGDYIGKRDPDEHVQLVNDRLSYFSIDDTSKCKLFASTLVRYTRMWFNSMADGNIDFWVEFCESFSTYFTAWKRQPIIKVALSEII